LARDPASLDHLVGAQHYRWRHRKTERLILPALRFTAISNFVGNCTGRSPGFSPRRMRSKYEAAHVVAGDVPTRAVEPLDEAAGDRIARVRKDHGDRRNRPLAAALCAGE
jgi:hypothetical protein